jgi:hypothetical protein
VAPVVHLPRADTVTQERAHSVEDGKIRALSVSQLKTAHLCLSRWGFERVLRIPGKRFKSQDLGIAVHARLEAYLKTGVDALGEIERPGLKYLPLPGSGLLVEHRFDGTDRDTPFDPSRAKLHAAGIPLDGFIDVVNTRGGYPYPGAKEPDPPDTIEVLDHKTSSNLRYAATEEALSDVEHESGHGIQMVGYGEWARTESSGLQWLRLTHVVYSTGPKRDAIRVSTRVSVDVIRNSWQRVSGLAEKMKAVASTSDPKQWPRNETACTAFGGCPYLAICPVSKLRVAVTGEFAPEGSTRMPNLLDSLMAAKSTPANVAQLPPPPVAQLPPPPVAQLPPPPAPIASQAAFVQSLGAPPKAETAGPGRDVMGNPLQGHSYRLPSGQVGTFMTSTGGQWAFAVGQGTPVHVLPGMPLEYLGEAQTQEPVAGPAPAPEKRGRGRPRKTEAEGKPEAKPETKPEAKTEAKTEATPAARVELFINCAPLAGAVPLEGYIAGLLRALEEEHKVPDIRLGQGEVLGFGRWAAALAVLARSNPPAPGRYVVTKGAFSDAVLEAILPTLRPEDVVRGVA